jgi:hypothetical protein
VTRSRAARSDPPVSTSIQREHHMIRYPNQQLLGIVLAITLSFAGLFVVMGLNRLVDHMIYPMAPIRVFRAAVFTGASFVVLWLSWFFMPQRPNPWMALRWLVMWAAAWVAIGIVRLHFLRTEVQLTIREWVGLALCIAILAGGEHFRRRAKRTRRASAA